MESLGQKSTTGIEGSLHRHVCMHALVFQSVPDIDQEGLHFLFLPVQRSGIGSHGPTFNSFKIVVE